MPEILRQTLPLDPRRVAAALAGVPGTVVIRRDPRARLGWTSRGTVLLMDPCWVATAGPSAGWAWSGAPPVHIPPTCGVFDLAPLLARRMRARPPIGAEDVPMVAGWIGYEAGSAALGARHRWAAPGAPPDAWLAAYDTAVLLGPDHVEVVVSDASALTGRTHDLPARAEQARARLTVAAGEASHHVDHDPHATAEPFDRTWHRRAVLAVHDHLRAGDCYQINLTGFVRVRTARSPWSVFETESTSNPVGFAAHLNTGAHTITSHSPELLLHWSTDRALTAPIKGTLATTPGALARLTASAKDRAEHVMIVDLCRNDLGRSAHPGSVRVDALMDGLELRGLVHLVSEISARPRPGASDHLFADLFPGGSVTGAPKRRSCAILRTLEQSGRGPYTGSIGVIHASGTVDWNIAIRTALWHDGDAWFGCGGGIVLDSDPDREYEEAMLKAQSFLASARGSATADPPDGVGAHRPVVAPFDGAL